MKIIYFSYVNEPFKFKFINVPALHFAKRGSQYIEYVLVMFA